MLPFRAALLAGAASAGGGPGGPGATGEFMLPGGTMISLTGNNEYLAPDGTALDEEP